MTTWGNVEDFKHFLPRLCELLAINSASGPPIDLTSLMGKLEYANLPEWPDDERAAVVQFMLALGIDTLSSFPSTISIADVVWAAARTGQNLSSLLESWLTCVQPAPAQHLAEFVFRIVSSLEPDGTPVADAPKDARKAIRDWLTSADVRTYLESAFFACEGSVFVRQLSDAEQQLAWLRSLVLQQKSDSD